MRHGDNYKHRTYTLAAVKQRITGFHLDSENHWVAELACGHNQHVRHNPPWTERPWVVTEAGRAGVLGRPLNCMKCDAGDPPDRI